MPGYPGGLCCGAQVPSPSPTVLDEAEDGGEGGRVLRCTLAQREIEVTQGDPLSSTIFNVVVDAVVCHWGYLLVAEHEGGKISSDEVDRTQTAGGKIRYQDDGIQWEEERHQRLTVKAEFFKCRLWGGRFHRPGMVQVSVRFSGGDI